MHHARKMLSDPYAEEEMKRLLTKYYGGSINKVQFVNYSPEAIIQTFAQRAAGGIGKDHLDEFSNFIKFQGSERK